MKQLNITRQHAQAGFTLIELIIVIVILGVLAATALPKFANLGGDARVAKMQAAVGAIKSSAATFHGQWLAAGAPLDSFTGFVIKQEGTTIPYAFGYPTVAGIVASAGGLIDYTQATAGTVLTLTPDVTHPNCKITYTQSTGVDIAPVVDASALSTLANCQ